MDFNRFDEPHPYPLKSFAYRTEYISAYDVLCANVYIVRNETSATKICRPTYSTHLALPPPYDVFSVTVLLTSVKSATAWKGLLRILCRQYYTVPFTTHDMPPPTLDKLGVKWVLHTIKHFSDVISTVCTQTVYVAHVAGTDVVLAANG